MTYQIDQSIKIENTNKTTYVALSNGHTLIVSITAKEKQLLKLYFRKIDRPLIFKLFTFSVLCAKTIQAGNVHRVVIDTEYSGQEKLIRSFIVQILTIWGKNDTMISFGFIGKTSNAHIQAYSSHRRKTKAEQITSKDVLRLFTLTNKR